MKTATQISTLGFNVAVLPREGLTRPAIERIIGACLDAIEGQARDQEYDLLWPTLKVVPEEYEVENSSLQGRSFPETHRSLTVTVDAVREVEVEDE